MKHILTFCFISLIAIFTVSCGKNEETNKPEQISEQHAMIKERLAEYAKVEFNETNIDLSGLQHSRLSGKSFCLLLSASSYWCG